MDLEKLLAEAHRLAEGSTPESESWGEVQRGLEAVVAEDAECVAAWQALGEMHLQAQEYPAAIDALERATGLRPDDCSLRSLLGQACVGAGDAHRAVEEFIECVREDPDHDPAPYAYLESAFRACDMQIGATWAEFRRLEVSRLTGQENSQALADAEDRRFQQALVKLPPEQQAAVRAELAKVAPGGQEQGKPSGCLSVLLGLR